jgi:sensor domain CHASE-containing protein
MNTKILWGVVAILSVSLIFVSVSHLDTSERLEISQSNLVEVANQDLQRQFENSNLKKQLHYFWDKEFDAINLEDQEWIKEQVQSQELI